MAGAGDSGPGLSLILGEGSDLGDVSRPDPKNDGASHPAPLILVAGPDQGDVSRPGPKIGGASLPAPMNKMDK